nr:AroM family protein [Streptomyces natalensis]
MRPAADEVPLLTRLRNGAPVVLGHRAVAPRLTDAVRRAEADAAVATLLSCSGPLPSLTTRRPLLPAQGLVQQGTYALAGGRRVGVVCALPHQTEVFRMHWSAALGGDVPVVTADPYAGSDDALTAAGVTLADAGVAGYAASTTSERTAAVQISRSTAYSAMSCAVHAKPCRARTNRRIDSLASDEGTGSPMGAEGVGDM